MFSQCLMSEMIWYDVDVTGAFFKKADLRGSTFENDVVINVDFEDSRFEYTNFINCKLGQVNFKHIEKNCFRHASFTKSIMNDVKFETKEIEQKEAYGGCNKNYFKDLRVLENNEGKKRESSDIWSGLKESTCQNLDMSFASFKEVLAEKIQFQNLALDSSVFIQEKSKWTNVHMKGCVMSGANLTETNMRNVDMESCAMAEAVLYKAKLKLVNLQNSSLSSCHASESEWICCILDKSDISRIDLTKSKVKYSSLRDTIISEAEFTHAYFEDVIFENSNGQGLLSSYSRFDKCSFINAFLPSSNFNYTVFSDCDMKLSNMTQSTIEEARFEECNFEDSSFRGCCFIKVIFKNNKNVSKEIFDGCTFINCTFEEGDEKWGRIFRNDPTHYTVG